MQCEANLQMPRKKPPASRLPQHIKWGSMRTEGNWMGLGRSSNGWREVRHFKWLCCPAFPPSRQIATRPLWPIAVAPPGAIERQVMARRGRSKKCSVTVSLVAANGRDRGWRENTQRSRHLHPPGEKTSHRGSDGSRPGASRHQQGGIAAAWSRDGRIELQVRPGNVDRCRGPGCRITPRRRQGRPPLPR